MKIAITNLLTSDNGSIAGLADGNANYDPNVILDPSFSTIYNAGGSSATFGFRYTFTEPTLIDYVAIAGHNAGVKGATVELKVDGVTKGTETYEPDPFNDFSTVLMATFPEQLATTVDVLFTKSGPITDRILLCNMQAGATFPLSDPINNSEQGGYVRPWIGDGVNNKSVLNRRSEPTVSLVRQNTKRITLTISNIQGIAENPDFDNLVRFLELITDQSTWFMQERDGTVLDQDGQSNYLCFNGDMTMTAGANRRLNTMKLTFNAYIGARA